MIRASGGLIVRNGRVAVVHRARYDDCALREIEEETGLRVELGEELATTRHLDAKGRPKRVRWWRMTPLSGEFTPTAEVDELRWLTPSEARELLTYARDVELLESL